MSDEDYDPFERCYVHAGGLPRVAESCQTGPVGSSRVAFVLSVNVCSACRAANGSEAIRRRLVAQWRTAVSLIGKLGK
jgi:hypothetical protein